MNHKMIVSGGNSRLIMFFSGWGTDSEIAANLSFSGYDLLTLWDYRSLRIDAEPLKRYLEFIVVAWSFGVAAAARFLADHAFLPVTRRIAINGTLFPVDDTRGIPNNIFQGTLVGLNERNLLKFYRRMAQKRELNIPSRSITELQQELCSIAALDVPKDAWDLAFVAADDRIIPAENQIRAWIGTPVRPTDGPHLPDFQALLRPFIINKDRVAQRFGKAADTYNNSATVQRKIAENLLAIAPVDPEITVEIGSGTGLLTDLFLNRYEPKQLTLVDFHPRTHPGAVSVADDAETWITTVADESVSCIISSSAMQWFNSPIRFLEHVRRVLRPGGTALISTLGPATMQELEGIAPRLQYLNPDELPYVVKSEIMTLRFPSATEALRHMHLTGVNGASGSTPDALRLLRNWPLTPEGEATLTFQPVYIRITK